MRTWEEKNELSVGGNDVHTVFIFSVCARGERESAATTADEHEVQGREFAGDLHVGLSVPHFGDRTRGGGVCGCAF